MRKRRRAANPGDATLTSASQTQLGVVMGTPATCLPKQTSGRPDHRTDIFSWASCSTRWRRDGGPSMGVLPPSRSPQFCGTRHRPSRRSPRSAERSGPDHPALFGEGSATPRADGARRQQRISRSGTTDITEGGPRNAPDIARRCPTADSGAACAEEGFWVARRCR